MELPYQFSSHNLVMSKNGNYRGLGVRRSPIDRARKMPTVISRSQFYAIKTVTEIHLWHDLRRGIRSKNMVVPPMGGL